MAQFTSGLSLFVMSLTGFLRRCWGGVPIFFFEFFIPCTLWDLSFLTRDWTHTESWVLSTEPPGNSLSQGLCGWESCTSPIYLDFIFIMQFENVADILRMGALAMCVWVRPPPSVGILSWVPWDCRCLHCLSRTSDSIHGPPHGRRT